MLDGLALACIALPILAGILVFVLRASFLRGVLVVATGVVLALASLYLARNGSFQLAADTVLGIKVDSLILVLDLALMAIILLIGLRLANWIITGLAAAQIAGVLYIEGLFGFVGGVFLVNSVAWALLQTFVIIRLNTRSSQQPKAAAVPRSTAKK